MQTLEQTTDDEFVRQMTDRFEDRVLFEDLSDRYLIAVTNKANFPTHYFLSPAYAKLDIDPNEKIGIFATDLVHPSSIKHIGKKMMQKLIQFGMGRDEDKIETYDLALKTAEGKLEVNGSAWLIQEEGEHKKVFYIAKTVSDNQVDKYLLFRDALKEAGVTHSGLIKLYSEIYRRMNTPCPIQEQLKL